MKKQIDEIKQGPSRKQLVLCVVIVLISMFLFMEMVGWSGQIQFYSKWIECGQKPLRAKGSGYFNAGAVHYVETPAINLWMPAGKYFCTPLEAEQAGYSANPDVYDFPHIEEARERGLIP